MHVEIHRICYQWWCIWSYRIVRREFTSDLSAHTLQSFANVNIWCITDITSGYKPCKWTNTAKCKQFETNNLLLTIKMLPRDKLYKAKPYIVPRLRNWLIPCQLLKQRESHKSSDYKKDIRKSFTAFMLEWCALGHKKNLKNVGKSIVLCHQGLYRYYLSGPQSQLYSRL